jgi:hypothetical protein
MEAGYQKIALVNTLAILEREISKKPNFFVNEAGTLESFFTYKGTIIEIHKMAMKIQLGKTTHEEVAEEIRSILVSGIQKGYWIVFLMGNTSSFNVSEFFSKLSFNKGDLNFFDNSKLMSKEYLFKSGILKDEDDVDFLGNKGGYKVNESSRVVYLANSGEADIAKLKEANSKIDFEFYCVQ